MHIIRIEAGSTPHARKDKHLSRCMHFPTMMLCISFTSTQGSPLLGLCTSTQSTSLREKAYWAGIWYIQITMGLSNLNIADMQQLEYINQRKLRNVEELRLAGELTKTVQCGRGRKFHIKLMVLAVLKNTCVVRKLTSLLNCNLSSMMIQHTKDRLQ